MFELILENEWLVLQKQTQKEVRKEKGAKKKREYVPQKRSGGYAVLLTLYRHSQVKQAFIFILLYFFFFTKAAKKRQPLMHSIKCKCIIYF